jgi:N utilization substance protein A
VGDVVNGIIKRQEMGDFIVDLGRAEALLPRKEQSRARATRPATGCVWPSSRC